MIEMSDETIKLFNLIFRLVEVALVPFIIFIAKELYQIKLFMALSNQKDKETEGDINDMKAKLLTHQELIDEIRFKSFNNLKSSHNKQ